MASLVSLYLLVFLQCGMLVSASPIPLPDDFVVGVFPSLDIILKGLVTGVLQWLKVLVSTLTSGGSLQQLLGTLGSLFSGVTNDIDPGVDDLEDTLKEPITSLD